MSKIELIDSHAHLYAEEFDIDREQIILQAIQGGITKILLPNVDVASIDRMMQTVAQYPAVCEPMMGLHPCYVKEDYLVQLQQIESWLENNNCIAIGEIGLDFYWDLTYKAAQEIALRSQLKWAAKYDLPVVIHCRSSIDETIAIIKNEKLDLKGVFHCFSGTLEQAQIIIKMGFVLGIGGVATFKNGGLDKILPHLSLDKIILETDSPYLAPVPHRGKRNSPTNLPLVAEKLSDIYQMSLENIATITTETATKLFNLDVAKKS